MVNLSRAVDKRVHRAAKKVTDFKEVDGIKGIRPAAGTRWWKGSWLNAATIRRDAGLRKSVRFAGFFKPIPEIHRAASVLKSETQINTFGEIFRMRVPQTAGAGFRLLANEIRVAHKAIVYPLKLPWSCRMANPEFSWVSALPLHGPRLQKALRQSAKNPVSGSRVRSGT